MTQPPSRPDPASGPGADPAPVVDTGPVGESECEALMAAIVEMTHAQGEDVTPRDDAQGVTLVRRTPFLRVAHSADGGAELLFYYPAGRPDDARLIRLPDAPAESPTHRLHLDSCSMDADLIALEPLIEAAYAQNG